VAVPLHGTIEDPLDVGAPRDVGDDRERLRAAVRAHGFQLALAPRGEHGTRAVAGHEPREYRADPAAGPGDDDDSVTHGAQSTPLQ